MDKMRRHAYGEMVEFDTIGYSEYIEQKNISKYRGQNTCPRISAQRKYKSIPHRCMDYETVGRSRISLAIILHLLIFINNSFPVCRALVIPTESDLSSESIPYQNDDEDNSFEQPVVSTEDIGVTI